MKGRRVEEGRPPRRRRLLVVVVDRDDDLGLAGIRTPILGREAVLDAAVRFALARPEDSDLNAIFAGLNLLDSLREKGYEADIVLVSGHPYDSVEADMRIREQVRWAVEVTGAREAVLVSDGAEDELVLPALRGVVDVVSVRRVIVEQSRGVEETLTLIARYFRKAVEEPRFARLVLGVPGLAFIVFSSLALVGYLWHALLLGLLVAGVAMVVRGFGLEERMSELFTRTPVIAIAYALAAIVAGTGVGIAVYQLTLTSPTVSTVAETVKSLNVMLGLAASIAVLSHAISKLVSGNIRVSREVTALSIVAVIAVLVDNIASALASIRPGEQTANLIAPLLLRSNVALYAIGGVLAIALVWKLSSYLEEIVSRSLERGGG